MDGLSTYTTVANRPAQVKLTSRQKRAGVQKLVDEPVDSGGEGPAARGHVRNHNHASCGRLWRLDSKSRSSALDITAGRWATAFLDVFTRVGMPGKVGLGNLRRWGITDGWLTTTRAIIANFRPSPFRPACWWSTFIPAPPAGTAASPRPATARRDPPGSRPGAYYFGRDSCARPVLHTFYLVPAQTVSLQELRRAHHDDSRRPCSTV
jgi:hypothetical protein